MKAAPRKSAIPTPGRSRSSSSATQAVPVPDVAELSRAFTEAIKANDPSQHRTSRPPSRQSDVFMKSTTPRPFQVGDNVRIESLGFEGLLRYLGGIDGKPGLWAGVELSGGFYGKGKNDGSVNGKQYFSCPANCGVFVATAKLSPATAGPGAIIRPSSVASSRGGRTTPSVSGRTTPSSFSFSTTSRIPSGGRITPSGRTTPGIATPAARARPKGLTKTPNVVATPLTGKLTAGSRASKYASMTAQQLSTRDSALEPPARTAPSPSLSTRSTSSPTRPPASPFTTPKPSIGGRPSIGTPRPRIPSAVAMPPPASPALREPISPRPESASSNRSTTFDDRLQLQSRIVSLENELDETKTQAVERLTQVEEGLQTRIAVLETQLQEEQTNSNLQAAQLEQHLAESTSLELSLKDTISSREASERETAEKLMAKQAEFATLELRLKHTQMELEEERADLRAQVDELRQAGQETIALYEERLNEAEKEKYELETRLSSLEMRYSTTPRSPSPTTSPRVVSSATEIDNEALREQVGHLQKKVTKLEDALEDAQAASEREEAAFGERMRRLKDKEDAMKKELNEGRKDVERMIKSEGDARRRVEEVEAALQESTTALEDARAEVEGLRTELHNLEGLVSGIDDEGDLHSRIAQIADRAAADKQRFVDEITRLKETLEDMCQQRDEAAVETRRLRETMAGQATELELIKQKSNRDTTPNGPPQSPSIPSAAKEEIRGLKHIVQELQKENLATTQRMKVLESENQLLLSETEQLRKVQILEENLDNSLTREEDAHADLPIGDTADLQRALRDQKLKADMEIEQLRKRLADSDMKNARVVHDLNKEISELEALIESKIYREDELERELEKSKEKLARQRKSSKGIDDVPIARARAGSISASETSDSQQPVCEICDQPGHDVFSCTLLIGSSKDGGVPESDLFCTDCESKGHVAQDCPHSLDVF
ncbi:hypothetical protein MIND_00043700 [Mycena indigotica]|uniref:CAP-Gly domain-containing protein n=1 Tax=Mycena indigotica TaxID=2126181 RepID=A0A8H6TEI3_9AGAR|nr:uncharacterized protein MIND_00043700 [Mycena indigotica]KAF7315292.1 hypothetical protein MIND_00043700 [Mycena indigotica]